MPSSGGTYSRRNLLRFGTLVLAGGGVSAVLAACGAAPASPTAAPAAAKPTEAAKPAATTAPAAEATKPAAAGATAAPAVAATTAPAASATQATAAKPAASAPYNIRFITWWEPLDKYLQDVTKVFEAANPGLTVKTEFLGDGYVEKMEASMVAGTWADAAIIENSVQVKFMDTGYHFDMTEATKADGINLQSDWELMGLEVWEGKVLCMPFDNDPRGIYYNKTAFKEAGVKDPWDDLKGNWTWADMEDAAKKLTKKDGDKITRYGLAWNYTSYQEFSPLVWTIGGNYADWKTLKYTLDDPKVLEIHKMLYRWANEDKIMVPKSVASGMFGADDPMGGAFRGGYAAMYHRAAYDVNGTNEAVKGKFDWDVAPFPNKDAGTLGTPVTSGNPHYVWKGSKNPDAAYKWLRTLSGDEFQQLLGKAKVMVPANKKAWKAYQTSEPPKHAESFIKWIYGRPHGFHFYNAGASAAGTAIDAELDLAYLGKQTLEQALAKAQTAANKAVNFGKATNPFAFTVPKPADKDLNKWGVA